MRLLWILIVVEDDVLEAVHSLYVHTSNFDMNTKQLLDYYYVCQIQIYIFCRIEIELLVSMYNDNCSLISRDTVLLHPSSYLVRRSSFSSSSIFCASVCANDVEKCGVSVWRERRKEEECTRRTVSTFFEKTRKEGHSLSLLAIITKLRYKFFNQWRGSVVSPPS